MVNLMKNVKEVSRGKGKKLELMATYLQTYLFNKTGKSALYYLEYKPEWLKTVPDKSTCHEHWKTIKSLYYELVDGKYDLEERMQLCKKHSFQSFDIWFGDPFNFAVEFDESQHFSQFRKITLDYYKEIRTGFDINYYRQLMINVKPGTSGFQRLRSYDPLFPELLPGENQDNRIRQRAFRDFLKDVLPVEMGFNPTVRIPYHLSNKKVKDFNSEDLKKIENYFADTMIIAGLV